MWARIVIMWASNLPATVNGVTAEKCVGVRRKKRLGARFYLYPLLYSDDLFLISI